MGLQQSGNGSSKFDIHQQDMGGWVRVFTDSSPSLPNDLPVYLSHVLTEWFRQHPQLRMRAVIPISVDGRTMELHGWYDLGIFPAPAAETT
jgi:hypothetical protein